MLQKKWDEAGKDLDSAIQLSAGNAEAFRLRGHVLLKLNRLDDAWKDVETAMRLAPKDIDVIVLRGDVREAMRLAGKDDPSGLDPVEAPRTRLVGH